MSPYFLLACHNEGQKAVRRQCVTDGTQVEALGLTGGVTLRPVPACTFVPCLQRSTDDGLAVICQVIRRPRIRHGSSATAGGIVDDNCMKGITVG